MNETTRIRKHLLIMGIYLSLQTTERRKSNKRREFVFLQSLLWYFNISVCCQIKIPTSNHFWVPPTSQIRKIIRFSCKITKENEEKIVCRQLDSARSEHISQTTAISNPPSTRLKHIRTQIRQDSRSIESILFQFFFHWHPDNIDRIWFNETVS